MILSQQIHHWGGKTLALQRALSPSWRMACCDYGGFFDDERQFQALGRELDSTRMRLSVVLHGRSLACAPGQTWELEAGDAVVVAPLGGLFHVDLESSIGFDLDWEAGAGPVAVKLRLKGRLLAAVQETARRLKDGDVVALAAASRELFACVAAEGFATPDPTPLASIDTPSQAGMAAVDALLSGFEASPQLIDLEGRLQRSRWTLTRGLHRLNQIYGLRGLGGATDWRAMRTFVRLRLAGILMSHPQATTRAIAESVGFGSPEAMCHAFANAGLPSPGRFHGSASR